MIKIDFQNRFFVSQKAVAAGFQAIMWADHKTANEVKESLYAISPDNPDYRGRFGYPNGRFCYYQPYTKQSEHAELVHQTVNCFMIEIALKHGVQPRCELFTAEKAKYYKSLGEDISVFSMK